MTTLRPSFIDRIKDEEGFSATSYYDDAPGGSTKEAWTWGFGTVAPGPNCTITMADAEVELQKEIDEATRDFRAVFQVDPPGITQARYEAVVDMLFNLGLTRFAEFHYTIGSIKEGKWLNAAAHAQQSLWYRQVGRRARRIVEELRTGVGMYEDAVPPPSPSSVPVPASTAVASGIWAAILTMLSKLIRGVRR